MYDVIIATRILGVLTILATMAGCSSLSSKVDDLKPGMTKEQVIDLVGDPLGVEKNGFGEVGLEYKEGFVVVRNNKFSHAVITDGQTKVFKYVVNGLRGTREAGLKVFLFPGNKDVSTDDLQFQEFSRYVANLLSQKGYMVVPTADQADTAIMLVYGISDPQVEMHSVTTPVYGMIDSGGYSTFNSNTQVHTNSYVYGNGGSATGYGYGTANTNGSIYTPPKYGAVGVQTKQYKTVLYNRYFSIEAIDIGEYKKTKQIKEYWKTDIVSTGASPDLRFVMPRLVSALYDYLGQDTHGMVSWTLSNNDPRIKLITAGNRSGFSARYPASSDRSN